MNQAQVLLDTNRGASSQSSKSLYPHCEELVPLHEKSEHLLNHPNCPICFGQIHSKRRLCPVIVNYKADIGARLPDHICITCLGPKSSRCPTECGWSRVKKRPQFCQVHPAKIKIHRDLCRKCHWQQSRRAANCNSTTTMSSGTNSTSTVNSGANSTTTV